MRKHINISRGQKLQSRPRIKQKLILRNTVIGGLFGTAFLFLLISTFNLTNPGNSKANTIEISHVEEQVFIDDKSIAAPIIDIQKKAGPNTILIQTTKPTPETSSLPNEQ